MNKNTYSNSLINVDDFTMQHCSMGARILRLS